MFNRQMFLISLVAMCLVLNIASGSFANPIYMIETRSIVENKKTGKEDWGKPYLKSESETYDLWEVEHGVYYSYKLSEWEIKDPERVPYVAYKNLPQPPYDWYKDGCRESFNLSPVVKDCEVYYINVVPGQQPPQPPPQDGWKYLSKTSVTDPNSGERTTYWASHTDPHYPPIPAPSALLLLVSGLAGVVGLRRKRLLK